MTSESMSTLDVREFKNFESLDAFSEEDECRVHLILLEEKMETSPLIWDECKTQNGSQIQDCDKSFFGDSLKRNASEICLLQSM
ncbi:hypothetical protein CDAR_93551 [Caerostris darwini]|uniref:Uncharacterized protein n=1 Tax=Caerostris darwini TaxID=1538125 RepID=A0AAV4SXM0_9ARAC|nr:hypothetical protein CDAR_93551 [Caerostris darwini]